MYKRISVALLALAATAVSAHHSFQATFKSDEFITVEGVVTDFRFKNPHVLLYIDVENEDGTVTNWMSEGSSATSLRRRGWGRDTISKGETIRVTGNSTHDGSPMVSIQLVEVMDPATNTVARTLGEAQYGGGMGMGMGGGQPAPVHVIPLKLDDGRVNLTGAWERVRQGPGSGRPEELDGVPPFSEAGAAAQAAFNRADDPQVFCEPPGLVRQAGFTPHPVRITQNDDHIVFQYEEYGGHRVVYLGDELPANGEKSHLGESVARYEGEALIIETKNLLGNPSQPWGYQLSDQATAVEVYTRADAEGAGSILNAEMTVTDPVNLEEPWVLRRVRFYSKDYEFIENECRPPLRERNVPD